MSRASQRCIPVIRNTWFGDDQNSFGLIGVPKLISNNEISSGGKIKEVITVVIAYNFKTHIKRTKVPVPDNFKLDELCNPEKCQILGHFLPEELEMFLHNGEGIEVDREAFNSRLLCP